jgi:hypothetical protein
MIGFRDRIQDLEARVATEREMFAQALEDYASSARTRVRDRAVSPTSLFFVAGAGFLVGQILKRKPRPPKTVEVKATAPRWGGLLAGALMSAARVAYSNPRAVSELMQRIKSARSAPRRDSYRYRTQEPA